MEKAEKQRVLILSDYPIVGEGIHYLLRGEPEVEVLGTEPLSPEGVNRVASLRPHVVILTAGMGSPEVGDVTRRLLESLADLSLVCISLETETVQICHSRHMRAHGENLKQVLRDLRGIRPLRSAG